MLKICITDMQRLHIVSAFMKKICVLRIAFFHTYARYMHSKKFSCINERYNNVVNLGKSDNKIVNMMLRKASSSRDLLVAAPTVELIQILEAIFETD